MFELPELGSDAKPFVQYFKFTFPKHKSDHSSSANLHAPDATLLRLIIQHPGDNGMLFVPLSAFTSAREDMDNSTIHLWTCWSWHNTRVYGDTGAPASAVTGMRAVFRNRILDLNPWDTATNAYMLVYFDLVEKGERQWYCGQCAS